MFFLRIGTIVKVIKLGVVVIGTFVLWLVYLVIKSSLPSFYVMEFSLFCIYVIITCIYSNKFQFMSLFSSNKYGILIILWIYIYQRDL